MDTWKIENWGLGFCLFAEKMPVVLGKLGLKMVGVSSQICGFRVEAIKIQGVTESGIDK